MSKIQEEIGESERGGGGGRRESKEYVTVWWRFVCISLAQTEIGNEALKWSFYTDRAERIRDREIES